MGDLEELFRREFERLVRSLAVAFGAEEAADAVQDAFIAADRSWGRVGRYEDPAGWVRRAALNRLLNGRRDRRRRASTMIGVHPADESFLDESVLDLRCELAALRQCMRATVCLYHLAGLTTTEVAAALGIAQGTVKSTLHDARRRLRRSLEVTDD